MNAISSLMGFFCMLSELRLWCLHQQFNSTERPSPSRRCSTHCRHRLQVGKGSSWSCLIDASSERITPRTTETTVNDFAAKNYICQLLVGTFKQLCRCRCCIDPWSHSVDLLTSLESAYRKARYMFSLFFISFFFSTQNLYSIWVTSKTPLILLWKDFW